LWGEFLKKITKIFKRGGWGRVSLGKEKRKKRVYKKKKQKKKRRKEAN